MASPSYVHSGKYGRRNAKFQCVAGGEGAKEGVERQRLMGIEPTSQAWEAPEGKPSLGNMRETQVEGRFHPCFVKERMQVLQGQVMEG